jgi:hypothetical protein
MDRPLLIYLAVCLPIAVVIVAWHWWPLFTDLTSKSDTGDKDSSVDKPSTKQ